MLYILQVPYLKPILINVANIACVVLFSILVHGVGITGKKYVANANM